MIAPQPFYEDRGTPIVLRRVIQAASMCGHEVDLLTFPGGQSIAINGLSIDRVGAFLGISDIPIGFSLKKLILDLFLLPATARKLRDQRYDCIHAVEEAAFLALLVSRRYRVPLLYDMQSSLPEQLAAMRVFRLVPVQALLRRIESWLIRRVDKVACSVGLQGHVERIAPETPVIEWRYPSDDATISISRNDELRSELNIAIDRFVVAYTGNFAPYQGVDRLVRAIPEVLREIPSAVFLFIGAGNDEALPGTTFDRSFLSAVRVLPRQPQEKIAHFVALADVAVSPRECTANLPLKVLDYMAAGKPIVASDIPAHRNVLNSDSAMLVEGSPSAIAAGIVKLYRDPELSKRLANNARRFAMENLGWGVFIREVDRLYGTIVRRSLE